MTKEHRKFNIILATSDSFVHDWLENFVGNNRFRTIVIGDLSKDEAIKYWNKEVTWNGFYGHPKLTFEEVYETCGGNMFLLLELYDDYVTSGKHPCQSPYVYQAVQAYKSLLKAMSPDNPFYQDPLKTTPKWTKDYL